MTAFAALVATANLSGGAGSVIAAGTTFSPVASVSGDVLAYAGQNARIAAPVVRFTTTSAGGTTNRIATATVVGGTVAIGGTGSKLTSIAVVGGETKASVESGAEVTATDGDVEVLASSLNTATASTRGGTGAAGISLQFAEAEATVDSATTAAVERGAIIVTGDLDVIATATDTATSTIFVVSISLTGSGARASTLATTASRVEARIGPAASASSGGAIAEVTASRDVKVESASTTAATAKANGGSGAIAASGSKMDATAYTLGSSTARIGDRTKIDARSLVVQAVAPDSTNPRDPNRVVSATLDQGAGAILGAGADGTSHAILADATVAEIGNDADVDTRGSTTVLADSIADVEAQSNAKTGSVGVSVSLAQALAVIGRPATGSDPNNRLSTLRSGIDIADVELSALDLGSFSLMDIVRGNVVLGDAVTKAHVAEGASVDAATIDVLATASNAAEAELYSLGIALLGGGASGNGIAFVDADVEASVGPATGGSLVEDDRTVLDADVNIEILAKSSALAEGNVSGGGGGIGGGADLNGESTVAGVTRAFPRQQCQR